MESNVTRDLARLRRLAYHRLESGGELVRRFHALSHEQRNHHAFSVLGQLYEWLFVPLTLCPVDMNGLFRSVLGCVESGKKLNATVGGILNFLPALPDQATQAAVAAHEHAVTVGDYQPMIHAHCKYELSEKKLARDTRFRADWQRIKTLFDVEKFRDRKRIIRRRLVAERSMRSDWQFQQRSAADKFQTAFDLFCHRWNLYGMQGDQPLLLNLTVNLTPYGTMIFIPAYWSLDAKRDLDWHAVAELHRARGVPKQGAKLGNNRLERERIADRALRLWDEATKKGLKGDARTERVMEKLGWNPLTDASSLRRLIRDARTGG